MEDKNTLNNNQNHAEESLNPQRPLEGMGKMVFNRDSLEVIKRARGDKPQFRYDLPDEIKEKLAQLDKEAKKEQEQERLNAQAHVLENEGLDKEEPMAEEKKEDSASSQEESLYYAKAQKFATKSKTKVLATASSFKRNLRLFLVIAIAFAGYYYYAANIREDDLTTIEDLKNALPIELDDYTTLTEIKEESSNLTMRFVKSADYYANVTVEQRDASLDRIVANAQGLCKNPLLGSIVRNGRELTVILSAEDGSYERVMKISSCDLKE